MNRSISSTLDTIGQLKPELLLKNNIVIGPKMVAVLLSFLLMYTPSVMKDNSKTSFNIVLLGLIVGYVIWSYMIFNGQFHSKTAMVWIFLVLCAIASVLWRTTIVHEQGDEQQVQMYKTTNVVMSFVFLLSFYMISAAPA